MPLLAATRMLLDEWRAVGADDEIVFPASAGGFMYATHFDNRVWAMSRKRAGTAKVKGKTWDCSQMTFHQLRHTFASICFAAGRDIWEVAHWIGDDPEMVKKVYGHYLPDSIGDTSRLDRMLTLSPKPEQRKAG